jgi:hypothetical protein
MERARAFSRYSSASKIRSLLWLTIGRLGFALFAPQTSQGAYFVALHRVDTRRAVLRPADV